MKHKVVLTACLLMLCSIATTQQGRAADADNQPPRSYLKGMDGVAISLQGFDNPVNVSDSLITETQIRTDVELKLRQNGIPIRDREDLTKSYNYGLLVISINFVKTPPEIPTIYAYYTSVGLLQWVKIPRDSSVIKPDNIQLSDTWEASYLGFAGALRADLMRKAIDDQVDSFCNDYLATHQKPAVPTTTPNATQK